MTGITVGDAAVGAVRPCCKLRSHDMTVDANPGVIREVGGGIGYLQQKEKKSRKSPENYNHRSPPVYRRCEETNQFIRSAHGSSLMPVRFMYYMSLPGSPAAEGYVKFTKHKPTRAVPYLLSIVNDSLITVGSPR